jgi:hypothetical protein
VAALVVVHHGEVFRRVERQVIFPQNRGKPFQQRNQRLCKGTGAGGDASLDPAGIMPSDLKRTMTVAATYGLDRFATNLTCEDRNDLKYF